MWARVVCGLRCHSSSDALNTRKFLQAPRAFTSCRKASNEPTNLAVPRPPTISNSEKDAMLSLRAEGLTIKAIAATLGRSEKSIRRHLRATTIHKPADISHRRGRPIPQHERDEIHSLRAEGLKHREIAAKVGLHEDTVARLLSAKTNSEPVYINSQKGRPVSAYEKAKMFLLRADGLSCNAIAKQIGRDRGVIADHLLSKTGHSPEQIIRRTGGHAHRVSEEERHEMLTLRQNGLSHFEIAVRLRRSRETVSLHLQTIDRHDEGALRSAYKPWGISELQQMLLLRACNVTIREISQDTGRSIFSTRTAWDRSGCQGCPPCPIAFSKVEISSIRSLIRLGATIDKMLEHVSESSRPALEHWLRDVGIRLAQSRVPQPSIGEDDMKLIERLRLHYVRWIDIADRFGRTVDATRNQFRLWQKKNKNRGHLLRQPPDG